MQQDTTGRALHVIMVFIFVAMLCVFSVTSRFAIWIDAQIVHPRDVETSRLHVVAYCMLNPSWMKPAVHHTGHLFEAWTVLWDVPRSGRPIVCKTTYAVTGSMVSGASVHEANPDAVLSYVIAAND